MSYLCDENSPHPSKLRVNEYGKFVTWEGCTIIMFPNEDSLDKLNILHKNLQENEVIRQYIALCDVTSYHVTLRGIIERANQKNAEEYNSYLMSKYDKMKILDDTFDLFMKDMNLEFVVDSNVEKNPYDGGSINLVCSNEYILRVCEKLSIELLDLEKYEQRWHLTLGYYYKKPTSSIRKQIKKHFTTYVKEFMSTTPSLLFERPKVCFFTDMNKFTHLVVF